MNRWLGGCVGGWVDGGLGEWASAPGSEKGIGLEWQSQPFVPSLSTVPASASREW